MKVRNCFPNYDAYAVSVATGLNCQDESKAVQSMKEEADINTIVRRFGVTGVAPGSIRLPQYGDFTGIGDFREALEAVRQAEDSFMRVPSAIRARFDNDPQLFLEFVSDPANLPELQELGLAPKVEAPVLVPAPPAG